jgi:hypothetical protein
VTDKPHLILELSLSWMGHGFKVKGPSLLTDQLVNEAWGVMKDFVIDMLDNLGVEVTDEEFRAILTELLYYIIYREMTMLYLFPVWEQNFAEALAKGKRVKEPPIAKGEA